jgi:hypothetical protein
VLLGITGITCEKILLFIHFFVSFKKIKKMNSMKPYSKSRLFILTTLFVIFLITFFSIGWINPGKGESWEPLRWRNKSSSAIYGKTMVSKTEELIKIFRKAKPLNPPKGFGIDPTGEFLKRLNLSENIKGPEPIHIKLSMRIPPTSNVHPAGINIWINDPLNLLGEPVMTDKNGDIYLMPPIAGKLGGQTIYSRSAHPSGYDEKYPSMSTFPLWGEDIEPFLRSVVRPTFKLAKSTATTIFTSGGNTFYKPVSQERWILAMIEKAKSELAEFKAGIDAANKTQITAQQMTQMRNHFKQMKELFDEEAIIKRHYKSLEENMSMYTMLKSHNPVEAEKFYQKSIGEADKNLKDQLSAAAGGRTQIQEYENQIINALITREEIWTIAGASVNDGAWDKLEKLGKDNDISRLVFLADAGRSIEKLQAELKGLSSAQRNAPAYGFELPPWSQSGPQKHLTAMPFKAKRPSGLVDKGTGARGLVTIDPAFFENIEKDAVIKMIAVEWWGSNKTLYQPGEKMLPDEIWGSLDWQAIRGMVN